MAGIGVAVEITAGTWNEIYHRLYVSEPPIAPAHALLVVGMLILITGTIIGLSVMLAVATESKEGYSKLVKKIILVSLLVSYSAIWLLSAGSTMYVAGVYRNVGGYFGAAVGLAWITPMVMIPAMRSVDRFGTATSIGLSYAIVNFVFLVGYLYEELYLPLGVSSAFALDLAYFGAKRVSSPRTAAMLVGLLSGPLLLVTYYPFTPSIVTVQWTESLRLTLLASTVAGFFGGITGYAAVDGTRSLILKLSSRTAQ